MATSSKSVDEKTTVQVKLLIDSKGQRVLFAEAGKDFCDFLFTLLSLPVATVIRLLSSGTGMVGTLGTLYNSFASLSDAYIEPNVDKNSLLNPSGPSASLLALGSGHAPPRRTFYRCNPHNCGARNVSDDPKAVCPSCNRVMNLETPFVAGPGNISDAAANGGAGFVKGVVTYMVMDDLEVKPMSTISSIAMLNKFNVKEVGSLQEKTVSLGLNEGVKLLKASLQTKNVLSAVFLGK